MWEEAGFALMCIAFSFLAYVYDRNGHTRNTFGITVIFACVLAVTYTIIFSTTHPRNYVASWRARQFIWAILWYGLLAVCSLQLAKVTQRSGGFKKLEGNLIKISALMMCFFGILQILWWMCYLWQWIDNTQRLNWQYVNYWLFVVSIFLVLILITLDLFSKGN